MFFRSGPKYSFVFEVLRSAIASFLCVLFFIVSAPQKAFSEDLPSAEIQGQSASSEGEGSHDSLPVALEPLPASPEDQEDEDVLTSLNPRFKLPEEGTVVDIDTALMWTRDANVFGMSMPWQVAREYIKEMNAGKRENFGHTDWRMPSLKEMASLFDRSQAYPSLPLGHPFKNVENNFYWSSTGGYNVIGYSWVADMGSGMVRYDYISFCNFSYVWPVRSTGLTPQKTMAEVDNALIIPSQLGLSSQDFMCEEGTGKKPPKPPIGVYATAVSPSEIVLSWQKPEGAEEIVWYNVYRGNELLRSSPTLSFSVEDINSDTLQCYSVASYDTRNIESEHSPEVCARTWAETKGGTVWTSGQNTYGQLGSGGLDDRQGLGVVEGLQGVIKVSAGIEHVVALLDDGTVWAWGRNQRGQLGDGSQDNRTGPVRVKGLTDVVDIATGWYHSLALKSDGSVWAWGRNYYGQLGDGSKIDREEPVRVKDLDNVKKIAAGWYHSLALQPDGTLWTWGWNLKGQLGTGDEQTYAKPVKLLLIKDVADIAAGMYHSLAVDKKGAVWAWGSNEYGQLGTGNTADIPLPVKLDLISGVSRVSGGMHYSLALKSDGTVWAWGRNDYAQLGEVGISKSTKPVKCKGLEDVTSVSAGPYHGLALHDDGSVSIWGWNYMINDKSSAPRPLSGIRGVKNIETGLHLNVVLKK